MTHESSLCWSLYIAWGFADSEIDGEDKDFFALEVRVTAARSCYSRSRRCIVGTTGDWKRLYDAWGFPWFIEQKRWWKRIWKWQKREKKKSITNWRLSFVWNFSRRTASQFPQGHLLFWVAAHVNWMQQEFFLKKIFHSVERFDGQKIWS